MAETAPTEAESVPTEVASAPTQARRGDIDRPQEQQGNPALQPLDPRPLRHVHHGQTGAMWVGVTLVFIGFLIGGIAMLLGPNWPMFVIGAVVAALGIVAGLILQAVGFGLYEKKN